MIEALEYVEIPHVFRDAHGGILFHGTPDKKLVYHEDPLAMPSSAVVDYKLGRKPVQPAESNLQLRAYLTMTPAPEGYEPEPGQQFRPSSLLRRKLCPGSRALEATIPMPPDDDDGGKYAEEGTMLHAMLADKTISRAHLEPEPYEMLLKAEAMEVAFIETIRTNMKPGWGYGCIIQPRIADRPHIVAYSPNDLTASRQEIVALWHASHEPDAKRNASENACWHCRAVAKCDEHTAWIMAIDKVSHLPAASWTNEQWSIFLERKSSLEKFIKERYEEAKRIKEANPDALPGWELKPGIERRVITDVVAAWSKLSDTMSAKAFSDCAEIGIGAIEKAIWQAAPANDQKLSQKAVKHMVNTLLEGIIEKRRNQPSLVRSE